MTERNLPTADQLLPMVEQLLAHLRTKPPGAVASGVFCARGDVARILAGERTPGLVVILSTDMDLMRRELQSAQRAIARDPGDVSATEWPGG